jgi:hydrogenase maturation protein HypF
MIGICDKNTFEGEAAIALEAAAGDVSEDYPVDIKSGDTMEVGFSHAVLGIIRDLVKGEDKSIISSKFHNSVVSATVSVVERLSSSYAIKDVMLCGGVFQNMYLLERCMNQLKSKGLTVHIHDKVPTNDAGISLGQAYIIRERIKAGID